MLKRADVYGMLRNAVREAGCQSAFASRIDVSPQYLCDVLNGRRDPGPAILSALGLEKVEGYRVRETPLGAAAMGRG